MDDSAKIIKVKTLVDNDIEATDSLIASYLDDAKFAILMRLYPYGSESPSLPSMYDNLQCKLAMRYFLRRGAEGEKAHNENGINRSYDSVNDEDLLMEITPYAKIQ